MYGLRSGLSPGLRPAALASRVFWLLVILVVASFSTIGIPNLPSMSAGSATIQPASTALLKVASPAAERTKTVDHPSGDPTDPVEISAKLDT